MGGIVAEDIVESRGSDGGGERSGAGGESTSGGKSRGGDAKELHGCVGFAVNWCRCTAAGYCGWDGGGGGEAAAEESTTRARKRRDAW